MVAEALRALAEDRAEIGLLERWVGVFARSRRLERVAAGLDLALDVAGFAADATEIFEAVVVRLKIVIGDAPVLDRQLRSAGVEKFLAVALDSMAAQDKVRHLGAEALTVPVHERAAETLARQKALPAADRQRGLVRVVAKRHRDFRLV